MSTIKLSTAYQLVMTSLLLGAILGIVAQQLPLTFATIAPSVQAMVIEESPTVTEIARSNLPAGTDMDIALTAVVGHDAQSGLWLVCCQQNQMRWVSNQHLTRLHAAVDQALLNGEVSMPSQAVEVSSTTQRQTESAEAATALPSPSYAYTLAQMQQYSEQVTPRIYLYVSELADSGIEDGVANLALRVKKDGVLLAAAARTHGGRPDFTWPIAHERQHLANLKLEFPHIDAAGLWEIQLVDNNDRSVGPPVQVVFSPNELNREIYLHYTAVGQS